MKRLAVASVVVAAIGLFSVAAPAAAFHPADQTYGYVSPKKLKQMQRRKAALAAKYGSTNYKYKKKSKVSKYKYNSGGKKKVYSSAPGTVSFPNSYGAGSIVIDTAGRRLYYVLSGSKAYSYPVAVGKKGFTWTGTKTISRKVSWPDWRPPAEMRKRKPHLPVHMKGGKNNPLGAMALYLGSSLYRIHGTNDASSIGQAVSSGCIRMQNAHVLHLSKMAGVGTKVRVLHKLPSKLARAANAGSSG